MLMKRENAKKFVRDQSSWEDLVQQWGMSNG